MKRTLAVFVKEARQIRRDPFTLLMLLGVPAFVLLLYGYALSFDVDEARLAVEDRSRSAASRGLVQAFARSPSFDLVADLPPGSDPESLTARGMASAVLVVPESFASDLARGERAHLQLVLDGSDANTATAVLGYAEAVVAEAGGLRSDSRARVWFNPELDSTQFIVPGLIGFVLMLTAVLSTALSVAREQERGTLEQLRMSPLGPGRIVVGKTLPYLLISLVATGLILAASRILFGIVVKGSLLELFAVVLLYLLGALGLGLLVSTVSVSQAMAFQVGALISMLPAIFLSGFIFPIRSMPPVLQGISYAVPARYFLVVLRGIILKGAGLALYGKEIGLLALFAGSVLGLAWVRLLREERKG